MASTQLTKVQRYWLAEIEANGGRLIVRATQAKLRSIRCLAARGLVHYSACKTDLAVWLPSSLGYELTVTRERSVPTDDGWTCAFDHVRYVAVEGPLPE